jgi:hypothetical protein
MATFTTEQCRDLKVLVQFVRIYCQARHADAPRSPAELPEEVGTMFRRPVQLCPDCRGLLEHGLEKRRTCPLEPKPTCKNCRIHCYSREYRAKIREIMAFSGRKMILRGRLDYLWHYFF